MSKIATKMAEFKSMNESAETVKNDAVAEFRAKVFEMLKKSMDHISKCTLVKDGKKSKLEAHISTKDIKNPRYKTSPAGITPKPNAPIDEATSKTDPIRFAIKATGINDPIADFKILIAGPNEAQLLPFADTNNVDVFKFNKMNIKYIPDEIQARIEKAGHKIEKTV